MLDRIESLPPPKGDHRSPFVVVGGGETAAEGSGVRKLRGSGVHDQGDMNGPQPDGDGCRIYCRDLAVKAESWLSADSSAHGAPAAVHGADDTRRHSPMNLWLRWLPALILLLLVLSVPLALLSRSANAATLHAASDWVQPLLLSALGIGWITMAGIDLVKGQLRGAFHRGLLRESPWRVDDIPPYLMELPIERLAAQLQAWGEFAIRNPESKHVLLPKGLSWKDSELTPQGRSQLLQQYLDELQLRAELEWAAWLRLAAIGLSTTLSLSGVLLLGELSGGPVVVSALVIASGIVGGHFASVARDIVAMVERRRR